MIDSDLAYIRRLLSLNLIRGPVLELGTGYEGTICGDMIRSAGIECFGTDLIAGKRVDFVADFENAQQMAIFATAAPFGTILILNVLEHTFDPIRVLDNALSLLKPDGALIVLTPTVWPLHNYPMDTWRIMPNFYEEYANRRNLTIVPGTFEFVGFGNVKMHAGEDGTYSLPQPTGGKTAYWYGKIVHKLFNTFGRTMRHPSHIATAAAFQRKS